MEALEKDFEDLVESDDNQEEDVKSILDYFDDEGNAIDEEDSDEEDSLVEDEETDTDADADTDTVDAEVDVDVDETEIDDSPITSEEFESFLREASDEELDALPDKFFDDIPEELLADVELTEDDLPEGETDLQEIKKKSLGARLKARIKRIKWGRTSGGKASGRKAKKHAEKVERGSVRVDKKKGRLQVKVARLYGTFDPSEEDTENIDELEKKSLGQRIAKRKEYKKRKRTSGFKKYLIKQKKRIVKVARGAIRVSKARSILRKRVGRLYSEYDPKEDVDALLTGEEFSEEFKSKATTIFEAAVQKRVDEEVTGELMVQHEEMVEDALDSLIDVEEEMTAKLDSYLDYIVEEWMEENKLAVEKGIQNEVTETFLVGMKKLFEDSYIELPEEKVDVLSELTEKNSKLQEELDKQIQSNIELKEENNDYARDDVFLTVTTGMVDTDIEKFKTLTESVVYSGDDVDYSEKLETIKESYFNNSSVKSEISDETDESTYGTSDPIMSAYASALGRYSK